MQAQRTELLTLLSENGWRAEKIEKDLIELVPKRHWIMFPHWLITHGRQICIARKPRCRQCLLADICPSYEVFTSNGFAAE